MATCSGTGGWCSRASARPSSRSASSPNRRPRAERGRSTHMAMNVGSSGGGDPEVMMDINTTPLIDVMLVLIIMLIINIPVQLHSVNLNMPAGNPPPPTQEPQVVTIDVDFDGTILWNGEALPTREALQAKLVQAAAQPDQPEVHVRPNKHLGLVG